MENETLDRATLVESIINRLSVSPRSDVSRIVGISGPWGSGKTWLLQEVEPALPGRKRWFNPWLFGDEAALYRGFASLLLEDVAGKKKRKQLAKTLQYIGPAAKFGGFDLSGVANQAVSDLALTGNPAMIRQRLDQAFKASDEQKFIIIDDVDRLTPDELLMLFKLLRLVGDLPGFTYVLAYDEATLLHLMSHTGIAQGSMQRARSYLEKVIETRIEVPPLTHEQKRQLLTVPLMKLGHLIGADFTATQDEARWILELLLLDKVQSIRVIERYLAAVESLPPRLRGEVNFRDWALICYLRVQEPHALQVVLNNSLVMTGQAGAFQQSRYSSERANKVEEELTRDCSTQLQREDLLTVVDELFPPFAAARSGSPVTVSPREAERDQRVCSAEYFDKYFAIELPADAVSDVLLDKLLRALAEDPRAGEAAIRLTKMLNSNMEAVVRGIKNRRHRTTTAMTLFLFAEGVWNNRTLLAGGIGGSFREDIGLLWLAQELLPELSPAELSGLADELESAPQPGSLIGEILIRTKDTWREHLREWIQERQATYVRLLTHRLKSAFGDRTAYPGLEVDLAHVRQLDTEQYNAMCLLGILEGVFNPIDVLANALTPYRGGSGRYLSFRIEASLYDDAALVSAIRTHAVISDVRWHSWDEVMEDVNTSRELPFHAIAEFILTDWEERAFSE